MNEEDMNEDQEVVRDLYELNDELKRVYHNIKLIVREYPEHQTNKLESNIKTSIRGIHESIIEMEFLRGSYIKKEKVNGKR